MSFFKVQKSNEEFSFDEKQLKHIEYLKTRYENGRSLVMPALWMVQQSKGWISYEAILYLEKILNLPATHIYQIASFYTMYDLEKKGKVRIKMCKTLSCELLGCEKLISHIENKFNIKMGQTSKDGNMTLEETECLGYCNQAPAMLLNDKHYTNLDVNNLDELLQDELKGT